MRPQIGGQLESRLDIHLGLPRDLTRQVHEILNMVNDSKQSLYCS